MSSYLVRPAAPRDAKAIAEIHVATWQAAYQGLLPDDVLKAMTVAKRLAYWKEAIEYSDPQLLVATEGDTVSAPTMLAKSGSATSSSRPRPTLK